MGYKHQLENFKGWKHTLCQNFDNVSPGLLSLQGGSPKYWTLLTAGRNHTDGIQSILKVENKLWAQSTICNNVRHLLLQIVLYDNFGRTYPRVSWVCLRCILTFHIDSRCYTSNIQTILKVEKQTLVPIEPRVRFVQFTTKLGEPIRESPGFVFGAYWHSILILDAILVIFRPF